MSKNIYMPGLFSAVLKYLISCTLLLFSITSLAVSDMVVDSIIDFDQNDLGNYWYYYDDNAGSGSDDRPQAGPGTIESKINVELLGMKRRNLFKGDNGLIKSYSFTCKKQGSNNFAQLPFTMGSTWNTSSGLAYPFVGIGTPLAERGYSCDLTGATAVKFKIRSHVGALTVKFMVQTLEIDKYSETVIPQDGAFMYYEIAVPVTTNFEEKSIAIKDLKLPGRIIGTSKEHTIPFNIKACTKLVWEVRRDDNTSATTDTLDIFDVVISGTTCTPDTLPQLPKSNVIDKEFDDDMNNLGYYWYYFDDSAGFAREDRPQVKKVTKSSTVDVPAIGKVKRKLYDNYTYLIKHFSFTPKNEGSNSFAHLPYTMGETWETSYGTASPYVGIGTILANYGKSCNLTGVTAVKFKIRSHVTPLVVKFRVHTLAIDKYSEVLNPPIGAFVYYETGIPATKEWTEQTILISDLRVASWAMGFQNHKIPFDIRTCTKFSWQVQKEDNYNTTIDTLDIDDICLVRDATNIVTRSKANSSTIDSEFHAYTANNRVCIKWNRQEPFKAGSVSLIDNVGRQIHSQLINSFSNTEFKVNNLSSGIYNLNVNMVDMNGNRHERHQLLSIIK